MSTEKPIVASSAFMLQRRKPAVISVRTAQDSGTKFALWFLT